MDGGLPPPGLVTGDGPTTFALRIGWRTFHGFQFNDGGGQIVSYITCVSLTVAICPTLPALIRYFRPGSTFNVENVPPLKTVSKTKVRGTCVCPKKQTAVSWCTK